MYFALHRFLSKVRTPALLFLGSRLTLFTFVWLGLVLDTRVSHPWRAFPRNLMLDGWFRWDSGWYLRVVRDGYACAPWEIAKPMGYFPLYPLLIRACDKLTENTFVSAFLISNLSLLFAVVLLYRYLDDRFAQVVATRSILLMLCYPFAYVFSAMYTESLFLLGVAGAFYFSSRQHWLTASLFASIAGATRLVGVIAVVPVAIAYLEARQWRLRSIRLDVLKLAAGALGTGGYMLYCQLKFGDPVIFMRTQWVPGWGSNFTLERLLRVMNEAGNVTRLMTGHFDSLSVVNVFFGVAALGLTLVGARRQGLGVTLWALLTLFISLRIWGSAGRYSAVVWPMFAAIALLTVRRETLFQIICMGFCLLQALYAFWFTHGYYVN